MRRLAITTALAPAPALAACGGGDDTAKVSAAAQSYVAAFSAHDAKATCLALTERGQEQEAEFALQHLHLRGATCPKEVALLPPAREEAKGAAVDGLGPRPLHPVDGF